MEWATGNACKPEPGNVGVGMGKPTLHCAKHRNVGAEFHINTCFRPVRLGSPAPQTHQW